jgi:NitT/TauT family transport system permease protein
MKNNAFSAEHRKFLNKIRNNNILVHSVQVGLLLVFLALWEAVVALGWADPFFVSSPSRIWDTLVNFDMKGSLLHHMWASTYETLLGFVIGTSMGYLIATLLWWNENLSRIFEPYLVVFNSLPKIALGPLIILWVGTGKASSVTMAILVSVIITTINILNGFVETDEGKVLLMKSMHATRLQIFTKLVAPANVPTLMAVLKINVGMSWIGSIMGEYIVSKEGLGYLLNYGAQVSNMNLVLSCTIALCILAGVMYFVVAGLEKLVLKRRK